MKTSSLKPFLLFVAGAFVALLATASVACYIQQTKHSGKPVAKQRSGISTTEAKSGAQDHTPASNTSHKTTGTNADNATTQSAGKPNAACQHLTSAIATQALGSSATGTTASDMSNLKTADTSIATCAYAAGDQSVQLAVRSAQNSLGTSENATKFGSDRPAQATTVTGYGQSSYWDPGAATFNILQSNAWYIITTSHSDEQHAETVAKLLAGGL